MEFNENIMKILVKYHQLIYGDVIFKLDLSRHKVLIKTDTIDLSRFDGKDFYGKLMFYSDGFPVYRIDTINK